MTIMIYVILIMMNIFFYYNNKKLNSINKLSKIYLFIYYKETNLIFSLSTTIFSIHLIM